MAMDARIGVGEHDFETEASVVMTRLRESLVGLVSGLSGGNSRAVDLERRLGLSRTLGWQIHRLVTNPAPLTAGRHVPGRAAIGQVLRGARAAGVSEERLARVEDAVRDFESMVQRHAGDRAAFVTMLESLAGPEASSLDTRLRKEAFRLNSQIWGVQVRTSLSCGILSPGVDSSVYDMAAVRGLRAARWLRSGTPFEVFGQRIVDGQRRPTIPEEMKEDDALGGERGPRLLTEFCSRPLPELGSRVQDGYLHTFLRDARLGNAGASTIYLADLTRGVEWAAPEGQPNHHICSSTVLKPMEALVLDTLVHRDMFGPLHPIAEVCGSLGRLGEKDPYAFEPGETLPVEVDMKRLGVGAGVLATPHVPRYREMIESVLQRVGWDPSAFEVFRCMVMYPPLGAMVRVRFELPDRGNW